MIHFLFCSCYGYYFLLLPLSWKKSDNYRYRKHWKSDNYTGINTEKKPWTNLQNQYKKWNKDIKSNNFYYHKVERAITKCEAIKKSPILLSKYWKNWQLDSTIIISYFGCTNNIFTDCIWIIISPLLDTIIINYSRQQILFIYPILR